MDTVVKYPPQNPGEYSYASYTIWGIIPIRLVVNRRVDGWCVYMLPKYLPAHEALAYLVPFGQPTPFELVRDHGHKIPHQEAQNLFSELSHLHYAY